ncbi:type I restriction endonuclease subunit R [Acuticoccus mangrovi]|uniref:Type I restriction endonuclease subunit R n=1 Tax=Acuticoccus mangrovi TaxID=2796142 RepID=A0A934IVP5_9HYPH|nr:type I restriction endonuclease [Acuticoccus mangrovi]MBJ3778890.1 type I restriction endonuclease subunit R [Acuticoccus mangrovi]
MTLHHEIRFEDEICGHLAANGWLYAEGDHARYDRARALFPDDLAAWIEATQPKAWEAITRPGVAKGLDTLLDRLRKQINARGTLDVLRHGIEMVGVGAIRLAEFRPALATNPDIMARYRANRLRVVRQVRYSASNENALDLVLFLNGIPVATVELKTDNAQAVGDAIDQYRLDRPPKNELLLGFPNGALVHFAVSNREVFMSTKLTGKDTTFLPFNRGNDGGAGNPPHPSGHATAYLWQDVWERESWLELIGRYMIAEKDRKEAITKLIFPRFHQLDATRSLVAAVLDEGPGRKYLIQHSAGSGKTNSIAWSAHFLADLHDASSRKVFDTVIVVSDRRVIDGQLQGAIRSFERNQGVVETITDESGSKSAALAEALGGGKKIVVCTIQTFPFALEEVQRLAATEGKTFAVIADEAHSSQTGQAAQKLKQLLSAEDREALETGEIDTEAILAAQMGARASQSGITYVAFTATPKAKTLELFGRPDPADPKGPLRAFHVYSMKQAIEEGFILDVLQNYTPYALAFRLSQEGKEISSEDVERDAATRGLMQWVRLHPHNIAQKVKIIVEHYRANVAGLLDGKAKAIVVLQSRKEAVRWKLAIDKYIRENGYGIGTLVAFSGEVNDPKSGLESVTEKSEILNPDLRGRDIKEAFNTDPFQILLVANKFQTGFDQPLLCAMYIDRRLAGVQAVQTLSRLNRAYNNGNIVKDTTYVLDFSDSWSEVLSAFATYHGEATLAEASNPELIYDLRAKLDALGYYDNHEVDRVAGVVVRYEAGDRVTQGDLQRAINPVADRLLTRFKAAQTSLEAAQRSGHLHDEKEAKETLDALIAFKSDIQLFVRLYSFLSQIFDYASTDIEKRSIFYRRLAPLLEFGREREGVDLSKVVLTHHHLKSKGRTAATPEDMGGGSGLRAPTEAGTGQLREKERVRLEDIIERVNDLFSGDLTEEHKIAFYEGVEASVLGSETLQQQARHNNEAQFANSPDLSDEIMNAVMDTDAKFTDMVRQVLGEESVRAGLKDALIRGGIWSKLRTTAEHHRPSSQAAK